MERIMVHIYELIAIALFSGSLVYTIWALVNYLLFDNLRVKKISLISFLAGLLYIVVTPVIYLMRNNEGVLFVIVTWTTVVKFALERRILSYSRYERKVSILPYFFLFGLSIVSTVLLVVGVKEIIVYLSILVLVSTIVSLGWIIEKEVEIGLINGVFSLIFLIFVSDKSLALFFYLLPYGFSSIFLNSKDYANAVSSLFVIKQYGEVILEEQIEEYKDFVYLLINRVESRYTERKMHSLNVKTISEGIALEMGFDARNIDYISSGSMLHDIGYLGVDHRYLAKKCSEEDPEFIKHILIGKYILENSDIFIKYLPIVLYHHENFDGSGPEGVSGENIPLPARIVKVADVFENMVNGRCGEKYTIKEALDYIKKNKGKLFDPNVVDALERYVYKHY